MNENASCFVSHVELAGPALRVWVQRDHERALYVEDLLRRLKTDLQYGSHIPRSMEDLYNGILCCARFEDGEFYRTKINYPENAPHNAISALFIDYGNSSLIGLGDIRLLNSENHNILMNTPPLALPYILSGVAFPDLAAESLAWIASQIQYKEVVCKVMTNNETLDGINFIQVPMNGGRDLAHELFLMNIAQRANYNELVKAVRMAEASASPRTRGQSNYHHQPQQKQWQQPQHQWNETGGNSASSQSQQQSINTLPVGSIHKAHVTNAEGGPSSFSLQLKEDAEKILPVICRKIQNNVSALNTTPLLPGSAVLGRYPKDKVLRRGVVMNVRPNSCKVYFRDYGNSEELQYSEIYQLPSHIANFPALALQFSLANLHSVNITNQVKSNFRQLVEGKEVRINVTQPEESPLVQFCDMFLDGHNVRDLLSTELTYRHQYMPQERDVDIVVSFVDSPCRFFVQFLKEEATLLAIQSALALYCPTVRPGCGELLLGQPLFAMYTGDQAWYRARVLNFASSGITVEYVDYGNRELIGPEQVVLPTRELVWNWRAQAVECCLVDFEETANWDSEVCDALENLILSQTFTMRLHSVLPNNRLLVDLISGDRTSVTGHLKELLLQIKPKKQVEQNLMVTAEGNKRVVANQKASTTNRYEREKPHHSRNQRNQFNEHDDRLENYDEVSRGRNWNNENNNKLPHKGVSNRLKTHHGRDGGGARLSNDTSSNDSTDMKTSNERAPCYGSERSSGVMNSYNNDHQYPDQNDRRGGKHRWDTTNRDVADTGDRQYRNKQQHDTQDEWRGGKPRWNKENAGGGRYQKDGGRRWKDDGSGSSEGGVPKTSSGGGRQLRQDGRNKWREDRRNRGSEDNRGKRREYGHEAPKHSSTFDDFSKTRPSQKLLKNFTETSADTWDDDDTQALPPVNIAASIVVTEYSHFEFCLGDEFYVRICDMTSPDHFYVHAGDVDKSLEWLRSLIDSDMEASFRPAVGSGFGVGLPVLARFKDDALLYRGIVKQITSTRATNVLFVDYGNLGLVSADELFLPTEVEGATPALAVRCSLADVRPPEDRTNWDFVAREAYKPYLEVASPLLMRVEAVRRRDGELVLSVVLTSSDGSSISEAMIGQGIAIAAAGGTFPASTLKEGIPSNFTILKEEDKNVNRPSPPLAVPPAEIQIVAVEEPIKKFDDWPDSVSLLVGQYLPAKIKNVSTEDVFYAELLETSLILECTIIKEQKGVALRPDVQVILEARELMSRRFKVALYSNEDGTPMKVDSCSLLNGISPVCPMVITNSVANIFVSHFEDERIYVQKESDSNRLNEYLENLFSAYDSSVSEKSNWSVGDLCCAKSKADDNWYRARVLALSDGLVTIQFIDYGNTEKTEIGLLRELDPKFYECEMALAAKLPVIWKEGAGNVMELVEEVKFTSRFMRYLGEWYVDPVDVNGLRLVSKLIGLGYAEESENSPFDELNSPIGHWLRPGDKVPIVVAHIDNPANFWVHQSKHLESIENLQLELPNVVKDAEDYTGDSSVFAALYEQDDCWYRAKVSSGDTIKFIDYGNYDVASVKKKLPDRLFKPESGYAIRMHLPLEPANSEEGWSTDAMKEFETFIESDSSTAEIHSVKYEIVADLRVGEASLAERLVEAGYAVSIYGTPKRQKVRVIVMYSESPNNFYTMEENLTESSEELASMLEVAEAFPLLETIRESDLIAAKYMEDGLWYRARVLRTSPTISVQFIDYGNVAEVTEMRALPENIMSFQQFVRHCSLGLEKLDDTVTEQFLDLTDGQVFNLMVLKEGDPRIVELECTDNGAKLKDRLVFKAPSIHLPSGSIFVSHCNTVHDFYIQEESKSDCLSTIQDSLAEAETFRIPDRLQKGDVVAAMFPEDETWYRSQILEVQEGEIMARFVDYGNTSRVTNCRLLPPDLHAAPFLMIHSSLQLPQGYESWSEKAEEKFHEIIGDGTVKFNIKVLSGEGSPIIVDLLYNSQESVTEELERLMSTAVEKPTQVASMTVQHKEGQENSAKVENCVQVDLKTEMVEEEKVVELITGVGDAEGREENTNPEEAIQESSKKSPTFEYQNNEREDGQQNGDEDNVIKIEVSPQPGDVGSLANCISEEGDASKVTESCPLTGSLEVEMNSDVSSNLGESASNKTLSKECTIEDNVKSVDSSLEKSVHIFVCHENSLSDFYIQRKANNKSLRKIVKVLEGVEAFQDIAEPMVGLLCCAKSAEDGSWYRCILTGSDRGHFIDFGMECQVSAVKELPTSVRDMEAMAEHCHMMLPQGVHRWSYKAHLNFLDMVKEDESFDCVFNSEDGDPNSVELYRDGKSIVAQLGALCSEAPVKVTRHNGPEDFHVVDPNELKEVEARLSPLAEVLEDLHEHPLVGTHVCVKFAGSWSRGKVMGHGKIYLYDKGITVEVNNVRQLPADLSCIPPLAVHCSLNKPHELGGWNKFSKFTFDLHSHGLAEIKVLRLGDPITVDLVFDGVSLAETLMLTPPPSPAKTRTLHEERIVPGSLLQTSHLEEVDSTTLNPTHKDDKILPGSISGILINDSQ